MYARTGYSLGTSTEVPPPLLRPITKEAITIHEVVFADRLERSLIAGEFGLEIGFAALSLALAYAGLVHADGRVAGLLDDPPEDRAKSVGLAFRIFDRIATQPSHKKHDWNFARGIFWTRDEGAKAVAMIVGHPVVGDFGVLKILAPGLRKC